MDKLPENVVGRGSGEACLVFGRELATGQVVACLAGAAVTLGLVFAGTMVAALTKTSPDTGGSGVSGGMIGGPVGVLVVGLVGRAAMLMRQSVRLVMDGRGLVVEGWLARRELGWDEVADVRTAEVSGVFGAKSNVVRVIGRDGRMIASFGLAGEEMRVATGSPWWAALHGADVVIGIAMVAAAAGVWRMRRWGRRMGIAAAVASLGSSAGHWAWAIREALDAPELPGQAGVAVRVANILHFGAILVGMVWPAVMLAILMRREVGRGFGNR